MSGPGKYCVNRNPQPTGEHEVHNLNAQCQSRHFPAPHNQVDLGYHSDCHSAVRKARTIYANVDGCYYCAPACHTR